MLSEMLKSVEMAIYTALKIVNVQSRTKDTSMKLIADILALFCRYFDCFK